MNQAEFREQYFCQWERPEEETYLDHLAEEYHRRTEDFDRTVCTGGFYHGTIMPATGEEIIIINRHALRVRMELQERAAREKGIGSDRVIKAIQKWGVC